MAGAGLRNGEACGLDWTDLDPASGTLTVAASKTDAGVRRVDRRQGVSNVERRLKTAIRRANKRLIEIGLRPIDEAVTPHSLRRLYASLRFALGDDPVYVANQLGHTEPGFSMKVYARAVRRRARLTGVALRAAERPIRSIQSRAKTMDNCRKRLSRAFSGTRPDSSAG